MLILKGFFFCPFKNYGLGKAISLEGFLDRSADFCLIEENRGGDPKENTFSLKENFIFEKNKFLKFSFKDQDAINEFLFDEKTDTYIGRYGIGFAMLMVFEQNTFSYRYLANIIR
ncbi:MAG: hypothetical protein RI945_290 [Candidatus Parcubacteria bacterium]|jgi:hypothetical protein